MYFLCYSKSKYGHYTSKGIPWNPFWCVYAFTGIEFNAFSYSSGDVDISDKHIEVIARRMISKIRIVDSGDTTFLPGSLVNFREFTEGNKEIIIKGKKPATGRPILLGITKASLETDSFLSAASFQD